MPNRSRGRAAARPDARPGPGEPIPAWPITLVARWVDPGYARRSWWWGAAVVAGLAWIALAGALVRGPVDRWILVVAVIGGLWLAVQRLRATSTAVELALGPDRLRLQSDTANASLERSRAGVLVAAETGVDWRRRLIGFNNDREQLVAEFR